MTFLSIWLAAYALLSLSPVASPANRMFVAICKQRICLRISLMLLLPVLLVIVPIGAILIGGSDE